MNLKLGSLLIRIFNFLFFYPLYQKNNVNVFDSNLFKSVIEDSDGGVVTSSTDMLTAFVYTSLSVGRFLLKLFMQVFSFLLKVSAFSRHDCLLKELPSHPAHNTLPLSHVPFSPVLSVSAPSFIPNLQFTACPSSFNVHNLTPWLQGKNGGEFPVINLFMQFIPISLGLNIQSLKAGSFCACLIIVSIVVSKSSGTAVSLGFDGNTANKNPNTIITAIIASNIFMNPFLFIYHTFMLTNTGTLNPSSVNTNVLNCLAKTLAFTGNNLSSGKLIELCWSIV